MRSKMGDKPLSHGIKDGNILKSTLEEMMNI